MSVNNKNMKAKLPDNQIKDKEALLARENEIKNIIKQCDLFLLIYMLKTSTNAEKAMSVSEVAEQLDFLIPATSGVETYFPERTLRRKFELFLELAGKNESLLTEVNRLLPFVLGGKVDYCSAAGIENGTNLRGKGSQKRFYFDPVLKPGDMDMICGALQSSRYLSDKEKEYLLSRLYILAPDYETETKKLDNSFRRIDSVEALPPRPKKDKNASLPLDTSTLLSNVQILHEAINNKLQVALIYGTYDILDDSGKVTFHARNEDKPYVLNPYATIWNDGEYYLIATHSGYDNPVHFRVDRIISVKLHTELNKNGTLAEKERAKIPASLSPFFVKKPGADFVFDSIKYSNTFPGMKFYQDTELITCCFECTPGNLQILIDNFGPNIHLKESPLQHSENELDHLGRPQHFLAATISGIQYNNALGFCIEQSQHITLLSPQKLVDDVKNKLAEISARYEKI